MQFDPDQREWLYQEQQERLRWSRRLRRSPQRGAKWRPVVIAVMTGLGVLAAILSSDSFADLLVQVR
jgi:hypothetical protein